MKYLSEYFCKFIQTLSGFMKLLFILLLGLGFTQTELETIDNELPLFTEPPTISLDYFSFTFGLSPTSINIFELSSHLNYKQKQSFFFTTGFMAYNEFNDLLPAAIGLGISKKSKIYEKIILSWSINKQSDKPLYFTVLSLSLAIPTPAPLLIGGALFFGYSSSDNKFGFAPLPIVAFSFKF